MKKILFLIWFWLVTFVTLVNLVAMLEDVVRSLNKPEYNEITIEREVAYDKSEYAKPVIEIDVLDRLENGEFHPVQFYLTDEERAVAEKIVMGEAGAEPYEGQVLVAQCLLNAAKKDGLEPSVIRTEYKYSGWNENPSESVKQAVSAVFDDGYKYIDEPVLYFYAPDLVKSDWHESLDFVIEYGNHRFFKE